MLIESETARHNPIVFGIFEKAPLNNERGFSHVRTGLFGVAKFLQYNTLQKCQYKLLTTPNFTSHY